MVYKSFPIYFTNHLQVIFSFHTISCKFGLLNVICAMFTMTLWNANFLKFACIFNFFHSLGKVEVQFSINNNTNHSQTISYPLNVTGIVFTCLSLLPPHLFRTLLYKSINLNCYHINLDIHIWFSTASILNCTTIAYNSIHL